MTKKKQKKSMKPKRSKKKAASVQPVIPVPQPTMDTDIGCSCGACWICSGGSL